VAETQCSQNQKISVDTMVKKIVSAIMINIVLITIHFLTGGAFWLKSELFLTKIRTANFEIQSLRRAKKKGVGGKEFLPALAFPPPPNFVFRFAKCAARKKDVVLAPPTLARTTDLLPLLS
jgi:hypothetical protein